MTANRVRTANLWGQARDQNVFQRRASWWTIVYEGEVLILRDAQGLAYLAALLGNPGREMIAADLVRTTAQIGQPDDAARRTSPAGDLTRRRIVKSIRGALEQISRASPELAKHLEGTVTTGPRFVYRPLPRSSFRWTT